MLSISQLKFEHNFDVLYLISTYADCDFSDLIRLLLFRISLCLPLFFSFSFSVTLFASHSWIWDIIFAKKLNMKKNDPFKSLYLGLRKRFAILAGSSLPVSFFTMLERCLKAAFVCTWIIIM